MSEKELWKEYIAKCKIEDCEYQAWAFGDDADLLAELVINDDKTATASAYPLYELENEPLPKIGEYSVILNSIGEAICVIQTTKVYVVPFCNVSEEHAFKEGEGDKSLSFWRNGHKKFFTECLSEVGKEFNEYMKVVCEEFKVVYKK